MARSSLAVLALSLSVAACSGKTEAPSGAEKPGEKGAAKATADGAATATPGPARVEASEFRFGRALAADGTVTGEGGPFGQGEALHVGFKVSRAPAGSAFRIVVTGLADSKKYYEEQKKTPGPTSTMSFSLPDTRTWPVGEYHLEMQGLDGADGLRGTFDFKIGPPKR